MIGLSEARKKRDQARLDLEQGSDPGVTKKLKLKANIEASRNTFEKVAREWHQVNAPQWAKVHAADVLRSFERDVFPAIGSLPITALTPPKLLEVLRSVEARSAIETGKRLRQRISGVYAYAIAPVLPREIPPKRSVLHSSPCRRRAASQPSPT